MNEGSAGARSDPAIIPVEGGFRQCGDLHCGRLRDLPLKLAGGGTINLGDFFGQKLVVFFCPNGDPSASARELESYQALAEDFEHAGAWVIGIRSAPPATPEGSKVRLGIDADGAAFRALASFIPEDFGIGTDRGTTFLIARDGTVHAAWPGCGHAQQALEVSRERP